MERPILEGYMALESWADDYSDWDGAITGPANPEGANKFWESPIPMIETRALDSLRTENERLKSARDEWERHAMQCARQLAESAASEVRLREALSDAYTVLEEERFHTAAYDANAALQTPPSPLAQAFDELVEAAKAVVRDARAGRAAPILSLEAALARVEGLRGK